MLIQNGKLKMRKLELKDNVLLAKWLSDSKVLQYYEGRDNPFDVEKVNEVFFAEDDAEVKCIIEYEGKEIGYIQFYQLDEKTRKTYGYENEIIYGTDQFIGEVEYWNKGIGKDLINAVVTYLIEEKLANRVVMDPQVWNERAIRCYEKCGFKKVKLLPKHELHEGEYRDCWLIEYKPQLQ
ncbi:GNAT family N-acetyltransferase [Ferdinandcohnia quinoae]|uniref:Acetyltransferase n=1 Tax=Fredinandcohnia quinoae TaxID=2918902 RepID=A0AAW5E1S5_9BACI|nr:GNAT family N-acetyltransferase [Fredinandcohnia sp. SECRCQ15]MCH1626867.1 acetyltransferase [Fredinandcohnia sp. SECRCQ15]